LRKGEQLAVANMELPRENLSSPMDFPRPAKRKSTFGMPALLSLESEDEPGTIFPETQHDFGMLALLRVSPSPSPKTKSTFGMDMLPLPSPEPMDHLGMDMSPPPSPEPKDHLGIPATPSPSPMRQKKQNFRFREPLFLPDSEDDLEAQAPHSPESQGFSKRAPLSYQSPAPSQRGDDVQAISLLPHAEDFGILPAPHQGPSQTGTHQSTEAIKGLGSSSKECAWIWGRRAPSPTNTVTTRKVNLGRLDKSTARMNWAILARRSYMNKRKCFKKSMVSFPMFMDLREDWARLWIR